ncbi:hypothetical protein [Lysinibacillus sphaericus]|uniref:hypothetical protein n=1 Tax=Lysinibacillus sphaericus TaxID=1421 RepID=UPI000C1A5B4C|nr:hypothetical protein [Lysinibacillus sphaericus]PIJ97850.1 hypothetical protein CTN02_11145 [Lysinibacillus sphaericus]
MEIINDMINKLNEAKYYLGTMDTTQKKGEKDEFTFAFRSFLASVRSVTQYAYKHNQHVYDSLVHDLEYKIIFTDLRNEDIHERPVSTSKAARHHVSFLVTVPDSENNSLKVDSEKNTIFPKVEYYYVFKGQFDNPKYRDKTLIELASLYVKEVEKFITDFEKLI